MYELCNNMITFYSVLKLKHWCCYKILANTIINFRGAYRYRGMTYNVRQTSKLRWRYTKVYVRI